MPIRFCLVLPSLMLLCSCASEPPTQTAPQAKTADEVREAEESKPPYVGMTKAQALARYGEPKRRSVSNEGEVWVYLLNFGEVMGKALIPFNFKPTTIRTGSLTFGPEGKVTKFNWDTPSAS